MNEYINSALYGEETTAQKEAKANAGYLNASDLGIAEEGNKFNITEETTFNGEKIPPGRYTVVLEAKGYGNDFTGNKTVNLKNIYKIVQETSI